MGRSEHLRIDDTTALQNSAMREFLFAGGLIDVYIDNTTHEDWQRLLDFVKSSDLDWKFTVNQAPAALPSSIRSIFNIRESAVPCLSITLGSIDLRSYFFLPVEIDFDIDPREESNVQSLQRLFQLLQDFCNLLGKDVVVTPEGGRSITPDGAVYMTLFRLTPGSQDIEHRLRDLSG
jgi:hypothetical protein